MSEWSTVTLADIADLRFSNVDKKSLAGEKSVRLCNYMDAYSNNYITANLPFMEATATVLEMERFKVEKGDNIITKDSETPDDIGILAVVIDDIPNLICGYHLALIKPKRDKVDPIYLSKQLGSKQSAIYFSRFANGSTRYGLSTSAIASIKIPLAPLVEQRKIADVLFTLDKSIEKTEALIAKYQQIKAGLMHDLFTRGVTADGKLRPPREQVPELYQETPIGWIPKEWQVLPASKVCSLITKGTTPPQNEMWQDGDGVRFLRVDNLSFDGALIFEASNFRISSGTHAIMLARSRCLPGDVLTNIVGPPLGKAGLITEATGEVNINQAIAIFRPNKTTSQFFLLQWLTSDFVKRWFLQRAKQTSGQLNLTLAMCQNLPIPQMSLDEQAGITSRNQSCDLLIQSESSKLDKLRNKKIGLMHDLLTGKVRLTLDVKTWEMAGG